VKLHFTPTYSSWLNQVEIWFARIEGGDLPWGLHVGDGSGPEAHALHPGVFEGSKAFQMEVLRCDAEDQAMLTKSPRQATRGQMESRRRG
jgi:hypothetical protein